MSSLEQQCETRMSFWTILGPLMILSSLTTLFFKSSPYHWLLACTAFTALILCWKWKWSGLVVSLSGLAIVITMLFQKAPLLDLYWYAGFGISLGASLIIATLAWEELEPLRTTPVPEEDPDIHLKHEEVIRTLKSECGAYRQEWAALENSLNAKIQLLESALTDKTWQHQQDSHDCTQKIDGLNECLSEKEQNIAILYAQIENSKQLLIEQSKALDDAHLELFHAAEQLHQVKQEHDENQRIDAETIQSLKSDSLTYRQEWSALEDSLNAKIQLLESSLTDKTRQHLYDKHNFMQKTDDFTERLSEKDQSIAVLKEQIEHAKQHLEEIQAKYTALEQEKDLLIAEKAGFIPIVSQEFILEDARASSSTKKNTRSPESMYAQLKEQFEEKSKVLDDTRRELFHATEQLLQIQRELEEKQRDENNKSSLKLIQTLLHSQQECEEELAHLHDLVAALLSKKDVVE